ncbi:MAG: crossover junction endodeoxyribonuclease RuvC [Bacteroidia bacterium]|nr:crossover junction endodeoxyribonuclease RuvC [Bacteroidia bacterium]
MAKRIILGIDPGTTLTGYGIIVVDGKKMQLVSLGIIKLSKYPDHPGRLKKIFSRITSIIEEYRPTEMALEAPFYGKNVQSMLKLGRAQGVAMAAGLMHELEIYEYAPRKVKMAVTGNGAASKEQVFAMLEKLLGEKIELEALDASDGLAVAVCHAFQRNLTGDGKSYSGWGDFVKKNPDRKK